MSLLVFSWALFVKPFLNLRNRREDQAYTTSNKEDMHNKVCIEVSHCHLSTDVLIDAEECWVQMTNALKEVPGLAGPSSSSSSGAKFVDQYLTGELKRV